MPTINPKMDRRLSFRCTALLVDAVDAVRGDIPRERWLRRAIEEKLENTTIVYPQLQPPRHGHREARSLTRITES